MNLISDLTRLVASRQGLDVILQTAVEMIRNMLKVERCSVMLLDESSEYLTMGASIGIDEEEGKKIKVRVGEGIAGTVVKRKIPLLVKDIAPGKSVPDQHPTRYTSNSFISLPLMIQDNVLGVINVANKKDRGVFSKEDLDLLLSVAGLMALSIHNAKLSSAGEVVQKYLTKILDIISVGLITLSSERTIVRANDTAARLLGFTQKAETSPPLPSSQASEPTVFSDAEELQGLNIMTLLDTFTCEKIEQTLLDALESRANAAVTLQNYPPEDPGGKPLELVVLPMMREEESSSEVLLLIEDLSLSKELSDLKRLDEIKSNFLSVVSHELRTPLTSIKGALHLINEGAGNSLPTQVRSLIDIVTGNTERLVRLVNNILDITEIEGAKLVLSQKETDLNALLEKASGKIMADITQKGIRFEFHPDTSCPKVFVDPDRIEQVIVHLLENAHKFTPRGGEIQITSTMEEHEAVIRLRDTGSGIPLEHQKRIFERFYQVDDPMTRRVGGSGLGLYLADTIIEQHGGTISLSPQYQEGAEFVIRLPLSNTHRSTKTESKEKANGR